MDWSVGWNHLSVGQCHRSVGCDQQIHGWDLQIHGSDPWICGSIDRSVRQTHISVGWTHENYALWLKNSWDVSVGSDRHIRVLRPTDSWVGTTKSVRRVHVSLGPTHGSLGNNPWNCGSDQPICAQWGKIEKKRHNSIFSMFRIHYWFIDLKSRYLPTSNGTLMSFLDQV